MGSIVLAAKGIADGLVDVDVPATHDPAVAQVRRPIVLVVPPSIDYSAMLTTWRLVCLSQYEAGTLEALGELDELVNAVNDKLPIEAAEPGLYALTPAAPPLPAYVLRYTT